MPRITGDMDMKYGKEWRVGVIVGVIAGCFAGWIWTTIGGWMVGAKEKNWWDIATAIGTVGAVIVALGHGAFVHFRDARVKRREGRLMAAMLSVSLPPVIRQLKAALAEFEAAKDGPPDGPRSQQGCVERGAAVLENLRLDVPVGELAVLAWSSERTAEEIAKAVGNIRQINARLVNAADFTEGADYVPPERYYYLASHCHAAATLLDRARRRCSDLSKVKYRIPDAWRIPKTDVCGEPKNEAPQ